MQDGHSSSSNSTMRKAQPFGPSSGESRGATLKLIASYVLDWLTIILFGGVAVFLGNMAPIRRPFDLNNATITFPFTERETVPVWLLGVLAVIVPFVAILIVSLVFVPGPTVRKGTPKSLVWRRKLWELHTGWLGLLFSLCVAFFITNGLKNLFGKPRPDLISRCQPDASRIKEFLVGPQGFQKLVTWRICTNPDSARVDDGFRSWPSGHASFSAAGLVYLSLFIASKFTLTIPFWTPAGYPDAESFSAFPMRQASRRRPVQRPVPSTELVEEDKDVVEALAQESIAKHSRSVLAVRQQAAAPPVYLFGIAVLPVFAAAFVGASRWIDYRHHGLDIFSGEIIGVISAVFAFRYYHMPVSQGAGWSWGPRSHDKAFWAGLGSYSFATEKQQSYVRPGDEEEATGLTSAQNPGSHSSNHNYYPHGAANTTATAVSGLRAGSRA